MASAMPPPVDHTPHWQLHTRQGSSSPPRPQNCLWPLPLVPPQDPACDPRGPTSLPSPWPLRRTFLHPRCPLSQSPAHPLHGVGPRPVGSCLWGKGEECAKAMQDPLEEAAKIPKSVQVALGCRPGGSGVDPFSLSLSLPPLPLRAQLPGKIIQATPLKRPHGRAPS